MAEATQEKKFGVFDFDGTIVDSMPSYFGVSADIVSREYGLDRNEFIAYSMDFIGRSMEEVFSDFLRKKEKSTDRVQDNLKTFFELVNAREVPLIDGAKEAIEKLHARGVKLFISTGSETAKTEERLEKAGLRKYFIEVCGSSEIEKGPEHVRGFAKRSNLSLEEFAQRSFFLGDGPGDMKIAKACRMKAVGVAHTFDREYLFKAGADIVCDHVGEAGNLDLI